MCTPLLWATYDVQRHYCDRCIINGERAAQERGWGKGVYCQRMGVGYNELFDANPGLLT